MTKGDYSSCCKVSLRDSVDLPPMLETVASAQILDQPGSGGWGILESDSGLSIKPKDGLLVGRTLVNLNPEMVPVHLMNLTSQESNKQKMQLATLLKVFRNRKIGRCSG